LKHQAMPLAQMISRLYTCFINFRNLKEFKLNVEGGAAFCEITLDEHGRWHPHLHCVIEGSYWMQQRISDAWLQVTGDSPVVDIRSIDGAAQVARYVSKYATKPIHASVFNDTDKLDEAILALRGRRLCLTFGTWRGLNLHPKREPEEGWLLLGRLEVWAERAKRGEAFAMHVMSLIDERRFTKRKNDHESRSNKSCNTS